MTDGIFTPFSSRTDYIRHLYATETEAQQASRHAAADENLEDISLLPEEGRLLSLVAQLAQVRKIVEIGTFYGYSALWLSQALPEHGHLWTIEKDPARAARARHFLAGSSKITLLEGDAKYHLPSLSVYGPFDMVFIDADKLSYPAYLDWTEEALRPGGIIAADNTLLFDAVWHDQPVTRVRPATRTAIRQFNARLADTTRYDTILISTEQGLTIARKKEA